jgi:hypothetical protein
LNQPHIFTTLTIIKKLWWSLRSVPEDEILKGRVMHLERMVLPSYTPEC